MKSLAFPAALALSAMIAPAAVSAHDAQSGPVIAPASTLLVLSAEGRSTRVPDLATFSAGVTSQGKTAGEAMTANSADMNRVVAALKKSGIAEKDIQTSSINLNPIYGQPVVGPNGQVTQEARIIGYQANNTVNVRQRDLKGFGKVLDALVAAGANQVNGPNFQMANPDAAQDEARVAAMKAVRARAELYAKASGLRVVRILSISEGGGYSPPMPVMYAKAAMADAAAPTPVAVGEVESAVTVSVQFELAP
ncbi:SIMPL domain-containing protein [Novosphingobium sp.]|uniref:SIMPL domain-containing protein n=1 Tax=Novosphingobium sp. TaxID=1874826 RepID=UPI001ED07DE1|nr:SIMPL domain-containing protein [Novosphingobium sp.]MBK6801721.1 SIMPL domain-containing protein [Novosphingobium sp.]MBK9010437.1 SIMPL domain-containing protein [Novosphingobium sp.]